MKWDKVDKKSGITGYEFEAKVEITKDSDGRMVFSIGHKDSDDGEEFTFGTSFSAYSKQDIKEAKYELIDVISGLVDVYVDVGVRRLNNDI